MLPKLDLPRDYIRLNSVVQAAKAKARGFKTFRNFRIVVFLLTGDLNFKTLNPYVEVK